MKKCQISESYSNSRLQRTNVPQKLSPPSYARAGLQTSSRTAGRCRQRRQRTKGSHQMSTLKAHELLYGILDKKGILFSWLPECSYKSLGKTHSASSKTYSSIVPFRWNTEGDSSLNSIWGPFRRTPPTAFCHFWTDIVLRYQTTTIACSGTQCTATLNPTAPTSGWLGKSIGMPKLYVTFPPSIRVPSFIVWSSGVSWARYDFTGFSNIQRISIPSAWALSLECV